LHAELLTKIGIALIFFLHGVALSFGALKAGTLRWPLHLVVQLSTFLLFPLLGLLLMRGAFVPGVSALDSDAQIISWAIVFGYAQQLFTRLVDDQATSVLEQVGGRGAAGDRTPA